MGAWIVAGTGFVLAVGTAMAAGDLTIRVVDMAGQAISGSQGGSVTLRGLDEKGFQMIGPRLADNSGVTVFTSQEIQSQMQLPFRFTVETGGGNSAIRGLLYDPFGYLRTYIEYQTNRSYEFEIPTPVVGQQAAEVAWNGTNSQLTFRMDLGNRSAADFWIVRAIWQKKAPSAQFSGAEYGLIPVLSGNWLSTHGYSVDNSGLPGTGIGSLRIQSTDYDHTFLAKKERSPGGDDDLYQLFLVNCLWETDLSGVYDPSQKTCAFTFNPDSLFTDTNAPAWDGAALKDKTPYFVTLQAQGWLWHEAGAAKGLAIDWGAGPAASVFYPILNAPPLPISLGISHKKGGPMTLRITGGSASRPYFVDFTDRFAMPFTWSALVSTQFIGGSIVLDDPTPMTNARLYRVRQP